MTTISFNELIGSKMLLSQDSILTIGVFDGMHKGHQKLLEDMASLALKYPHSKRVLITFSINPKTDKPKNVDTLRLRKENAEKMGVDFFVIIDFSSDFSKISASGFIKMLSSSLNPRAIVVGEDFRFGCPRSSASAKDLKPLFLENGKDVEVLIEKSILTEGGEKISSTLVRRVIENGEVGCIPSLTGRTYRVDLMPITYSLDSNMLVISLSSIQQLLPPPGVYWGEVEFISGEKSKVEVEVGNTDLKIYSIEEEIFSLLDRGRQLDSICFLEKENGNR